MTDRHQLLDGPQYGLVWCVERRHVVQPLLPRRDGTHLHPVLRSRPVCLACGRLV